MYRSKAAAWSPLTLAAAAALLVVLAVTETFGRRSVFCSSTTCFVEGVLWSLPSYAAMLAIVIAAGLIAAALAPPALRLPQRSRHSRPRSGRCR
jgi:hypothetical protein